MVLSLIDAVPMKGGWGKVWQSGVFVSEDWDEDGLIVSLSGNENWKGPVLWTDIPDNDDYVMDKSLLIAFVDTVLSFLKEGVNVLIHCNEGKYRSTYLDVAVHMKGNGMTFAQAYDMVQIRHPIAALRIGTQEQLWIMENILKGGSS